MSIDNGEFRPDYEQEHPGAYLGWILVEQGLKKVDFAKRCGRPTKTISEIIAGKTAIMPETAIQFERVLGDSAEFWLALEANYQLQIARSKELAATSTKGASEWAAQFPIRDMAKAGFISRIPSKDEQVDMLLRFFGVSNVSAWEAFWASRLNLMRFKQHEHHRINSFAVASCIRKGEIIAEGIKTAPYNESGFRTALKKFRSYTRRPWAEIETDLVECCRQVGVALAFVPNLKHTGLRGATFWAHKNKAVIVLSDHGKYEEKVWFSFFHEAGHILLHSKKAVFIDQDRDSSADQDIEKEADFFSAEEIVPEREIRKIKSFLIRGSSSLDSKTIALLASDIDISPGLLLERLQREGAVDWGTRLNKKFKRKLNFQNSS